MVLEISEDRIALRIVLLEIDRANLDEDLELIADKDIVRDGDVAENGSVFEEDLRLDT